MGLNKYKSWFNRSNISNILIAGFVLALLFIPSFKATMIEGLMKIGLFQPALSDRPKPNSLNANSPGASIQFEDEDGRIVSIADFKGKVVFVNFWATWCPPCIAEMPSINKLRKGFGGDRNIVFLMVDMDSDRAKSTKFMSRRKYDLDVYLPAGHISKDYYSGSLPTTLVFDKNGNLIFKHEGGADYTNKEFVEFLRKNTL